MSANIFRWRWTDINTGDNFKVEMVDAEDSVLTTPTYVDMPDDSILDCRIRWDWSNKEWGMQQMDWTLRFRINRLTFLSASKLTRPFVAASLNFVDSSLPTVSSVNIQFTLSNTFRLYRNNTFVGAFVQKNGITSGYNSITTEFEITLVPLFRTVTELMQFDYFERFWTVDSAYLYGTKSVYNIVKRLSGNNVAVGVTTTSQNNHDDRFWFVNVQILDLYATKMYNALANKFMRTSGTGYLSDNRLFNLPNFYKQRYDGDESPEVLTAGNRYFLGWVASKDVANKATATVYDSMFAFMQDKFQNFYNYLKDHADFYMLRFYADGTMERVILPTTTDTISPEDVIDGLEIMLSSDVIKNANASLHLSYEKDIDNVRIESRASYAQSSKTLPVTFNNIPNALSYQGGNKNGSDYAKKFGLHAPEVWHRSFDINWLGVYYKDRPYSANDSEYITITNEMILADNYVVVDLGEGFDTTHASLSPISYIDPGEPSGNLISYDQFPDEARDTCVAIQSASCVTNALLGATMGLFGKDTLTRVEGKVFHDVHDGGSAWFWVLPKREIEINLTNYDAVLLGTNVYAGLFTGLSNKYMVTEAEVNFLGSSVETSTVTFKAVSRELLS